MLPRLVLLSLAAVALPGPSSDRPGGLAAEAGALLAQRCLRCHGRDAAAREAELRLDSFAALTAPRGERGPAVVPGDPGASPLLARVASPDEDRRMPPPEAGPRLTADEVALLERWIAEGAALGEHWAFVPPVRPAPPAVGDAAWVRNPIDAFVLARLEAAGLAPAPEADRFTLARRLALDLTGLPPSPEEARRFAVDPAPDAYERYVDGLLASRDYGERWASVWLDLARYADSAGYGSDPLRTIWRWRDWVVEAFNRNLPYDRFTREQMAGDLLSDATLATRLATAFHRNSMTNTEGGTDDEEFRVAAVKDRVNTTLSVWMGLTARCAECHDHKYDPLSQREYYRLFAFFDQTADADRIDEAPLLETPTPAQAAELARLDAALDEVRAALDAPREDEAAARAAWVAASRAREASWRALSVRAARGEEGSEYTFDDAGVVVAGGPSPERETTTLELELPAGRWTALALETLADPALPAGGAGRGNGNFVLSELTAELPPAAGPVRGKRVRVDLPGAGRLLSLAEVEVLSGGENVALGAAARQSSTDYDGPAGLAVDGVTDGRFFEAHSVTHTRTERDPWWEVELPRTVAVDAIVVHNRTDGDVYRRLDGAVVSVLDDEGRAVWRTRVARAPETSRALVPAEESRGLGFGSVSADVEQRGFAAAAAVDGALGSGWAVAPELAVDHRLVLPLVEPLELADAARLTLRLVQDYGSRHTLGRLRVRASEHVASAAGEGLLAPPAAVARALAGDDPDDPALVERFRAVDPQRTDLRRRERALVAGRDAVPVVSTPVLEELPPDRRRATHVLHKGNFLRPGEAVEPGVPAALPPLPPGAPADRLGLAEWLVSPDNPLTARVAANRLWARLFGTGIVATEEDFGSQGELPSHPALLDWLAVELAENGWDQKALLRTIVTSATYRQASALTPEKLARDPDDRLLSRAPRRRLWAEAVRDQALAVSGLLTRERGGPPVYPPQPDGLWRAAFNGERTWATSEAPERYRRALYVVWRRTIPYPSMEIFDAPSRETCTLRRTPTATPLQAFVTLNDPVYVECAQALARRMMEAAETPHVRASQGLWLATQRPPSREQVEELAALYQDARAHFDARPEAEALALATDPLGPLPPGTDPREAAAWTAVANVLLNLDPVLTVE